MAAAHVTQALAETLAGRRRLGQLETWFDESSLAVVATRSGKLQGTAIRLASVRVQPVSASSAEVTARLSTPDHDYAAALRLTRHGDRWACTDLVMG